MSYLVFGSRELTLLLALMPVTLSALVHTVRPSRPLTMAIPSRPALAFDQYLVDLGKIQPTTEVHGRFVFENRGTQPVEIERVTPSCGCLTPQLTTRHLKPGETGVVILRMQPANELPGRKEYTADLIYHDPEPRAARVTFRLELPTHQLGVRPRALVVYQSSTEATAHDLLVSDSRPKPAKILSALANSPFVTVDPQQTERSPEFGQITRFKVTVSGELPPGRHEAVVSIKTDDPESPVLRVPMLMHGVPRND